MIVCNVKGVACSDEFTDNCHLTLQLNRTFYHLLAHCFGSLAPFLVKKVC